MCLSSLGCHSVSNAASGITSDPIFLTGKQKWSEKSPLFLKKRTKYGRDDKYFKNNLEKIRMCWRKNVWESWELKAALLLPPPSPCLLLLLSTPWPPTLFSFGKFFHWSSLTLLFAARKFLYIVGSREGCCFCPESLLHADQCASGWCNKSRQLNFRGRWDP